MVQEQTRGLARCRGCCSPSAPSPSRTEIRAAAPLDEAAATVPVVSPRWRCATPTESLMARIARTLDARRHFRATTSSTRPGTSSEIHGPSSARGPSELRAGRRPRRVRPQALVGPCLPRSSPTCRQLRGHLLKPTSPALEALALAAAVLIDAAGTLERSNRLTAPVRRALAALLFSLPRVPPRRLRPRADDNACPSACASGAPACGCKAVSGTARSGDCAAPAGAVLPATTDAERASPPRAAAVPRGTLDSVLRSVCPMSIAEPSTRRNACARHRHLAPSPRVSLEKLWRRPFERASMARCGRA